MFDLIESIRGLLKVDTVSVENNVFRLHYKVTMFLLVLLSLLVTQRQYFGDPIDCISPAVEQDKIDSYCWIYSTYTMWDMPNKAYPHYVSGIGTPTSNTPIKYHAYYQWVTLFLYFQALTFYLPRYLWKVWEGGRMRMIVGDLNRPIIDKDAKETRLQVLADYVKLNLNSHKVYAAKYFVCEILNFVNIIGQILLTDRFLGHEFSTYGTRVITLSEDRTGERRDPMELTFPKVTKCTFHKFGASGTVEVLDALCVLPLNIFNEKIFIFLWFWFIGLACITALGLLYRAATFLRPFRNLLLQYRAKVVKLEDLHKITKHSDFGDWFLLYHMAKNMDPLIFRDFVSQLSHQF